MTHIVRHDELDLCYLVGYGSWSTDINIRQRNKPARQYRGVGRATILCQHKAFAIDERGSECAAIVGYVHLINDRTIIEDIVGELNRVGEDVLFGEAAKYSGCLAILYLFATTISPQEKVLLRCRKVLIGTRE